MKNHKSKIKYLVVTLLVIICLFSNLALSCTSPRDISGRYYIAHSITKGVNGGIIDERTYDAIYEDKQGYYEFKNGMWAIYYWGGVGDNQLYHYGDGGLYEYDRKTGRVFLNTPDGIDIYFRPDGTGRKGGRILGKDFIIERANYDGTWMTISITTTTYRKT